MAISTGRHSGLLEQGQCMAGTQAGCQPPPVSHRHPSTVTDWTRPAASPEQQIRAETQLKADTTAEGRSFNGGSPPHSAFFSKSVTGRRAADRRPAVASPPTPPPITTTFWSATHRTDLPLAPLFGCLAPLSTHAALAAIVVNKMNPLRLRQVSSVEKMPTAAAAGLQQLDHLACGGGPKSWGEGPEGWRRGARCLDAS